MTPMKSGHHAHRFPAAGLEPVGRGQHDGVFGQDMAQQDQYRRVGFAAWAAYDSVRRGVFVDEDTEAKLLAK